MTRKLFSLLICLILSLSVFTACSNNSAVAPQPEDTDISQGLSEDNDIPQGLSDAGETSQFLEMTYTIPYGFVADQESISEFEIDYYNLNTEASYNLTTYPGADDSYYEWLVNENNYRLEVVNGVNCYIENDGNSCLFHYGDKEIIITVYANSKDEEQAILEQIYKSATFPN